MNLAPGNLVEWNEDAIGVVKSLSQDGRLVTVQFDSGEAHSFAADSDVLRRQTFEKGAYVQILARNVTGSVVDHLEQNGVRSYAVGLSDGSRPWVLENGLRPARIEDPIELLRAGQLDNTRSLNLRVAATRLAYAHQFDELSSLSNSRVEIKPHQVGVVHRVMTSYPHRFLLADEVGLGKTIEAGLIIKELKARGLAKRVLILAPSGIVRQWQFEMKSKFNETFAQYTREVLNYLRDKHRGENPWAQNDNVIVSTTFAAWDADRRREIALAGWDLVVVDEAHHARRSYQGESKYTTTNLYRLVHQLNDREVGAAESCLLLTATPMQLHPFELYSLVELLDPALFPSYREFEQHTKQLGGLSGVADRVRRWDALDAADQDATRADVSRWIDGDDASELIATPGDRQELVERLLEQHRLSEAMVRNRKAIVGKFQPRVPIVWEVELTDQEQDAYNAVTEYVRHGYDRARLSQNQAIGFLMTTFQRLLSSSSRALIETMVKRIERLERGEVTATTSPPEDEEALEESNIADALDPLLGVEVDEAIATECRELERLVDMLDAIEIDSKLRVLIERLAEIAEHDSTAKVIIFTHYLNTQTYLAEQIPEPWKVNLFHGGLKPAEKDASVESFREGRGPQLLISTEAGGEGRNFQFCHMMVNYDLPWNPMKVEQRIGRIDRIGQKHPVKIINFSTLGTIEERVVEVLSKRIGLFEQTVGGLDPILGEVERDLAKIFALAEETAKRRLEEYERRLETRVHEARAAERLRADFIMDMRSYRRDEVDALLRRRGEMTNDDLRRFVLGALGELRCRVERDRKLAGVFDVELSEEFRTHFPQYTREGRLRKLTFDPSVALNYETVEFYAFGHEIVDALVERTRSNEYRARAGFRRVLTTQRPAAEGWFFVYTLELDGIVKNREALPVFMTLDGHHDPELSSWLLEQATLGKREDYGPLDLPPRDDGFEAAVQQAESMAVTRLMQRQLELSETNTERLERERTKLDRFYSYKEKAAGEKLERTRQTFERLSQSEDPEIQRIVPVWATNLENAKRLVAELAIERERRLGELEGRDQIAAQHQLLSAAYVEIVPDPGALPGIPGGPDAATGRQLRKLSLPTSADELAALEAVVSEREAKLRRLARSHEFDIENALRCTGELRNLCARAAEFDRAQRYLIRGALEYFLLIDDAHNDLKSPQGFEDDLRVLQAVTAAVPDLKGSAAIR
jgi:SNF2 family DNA or RNA helicase